MADDSSYSLYGYVPIKSVHIVFLVLFSVSTLIHVVQSIRSRMWWLLPTAVLCGLLEILGWSARIWSAINPPLRTPYVMQITLTILAPTPLIAANFVILRMIINILGTSYSRLSPKWYTIIFCTADVISLLIQGAGGGIASGASTASGTKLGGNIALAGIVFQTTMICIFLICAGEFFVRYVNDAPIKSRVAHESKTTDGQQEIPGRGYMHIRILWMSVALVFGTICLFVRAIYRTIELADGWEGRIIRTQVYFIVLDGVMVLIAMITLNVAHPHVLLRHSPLKDLSEASL